MQSLMRFIKRVAPAIAVAVSLVAAGFAPAGQIAFNFASLNSNDTAAQIGAALSTQAGSTVTVSSGVQIENTYTGDNHVVGPTVSGTVVPWTLGDSGGTVTNPTAPTVTNPSYTNYLGTTSSFTMTFSVPVYSVEFDFEIYPDASPPVPQFEFSTADASNHASTIYYNSTSMGTLWTVNAIAPGATTLTCLAILRPTRTPRLPGPVARRRPTSFSAWRFSNSAPPIRSIR